MAGWGFAWKRSYIKESDFHTRRQGPYFYSAISFTEVGRDWSQFWAVAPVLQSNRNDSVLTFVCKLLVTPVSF